MVLEPPTQDLPLPRVGALPFAITPRSISAIVNADTK